MTERADTKALGSAVVVGLVTSVARLSTGELGVEGGRPAGHSWLC